MPLISFMLSACLFPLQVLETTTNKNKSLMFDPFLLHPRPSAWKWAKYFFILYEPCSLKCWTSLLRNRPKQGLGFLWTSSSSTKSPKLFQGILISFLKMKIFNDIIKVSLVWEIYIELLLWKWYQIGMTTLYSNLKL